MHIKNRKKLLTGLLFAGLFFAIFAWNGVGAQVIKAQAATNQKVFIYNPNRIIPQNSKTRIVLQGTKNKAKWRSSNPKQIKVNQSGVVTVKKKGSAVIYADVREKGVRYIIPCYITVLYKYDEKNVPITDITTKQVKRYKKAYKTKSTKGLSTREKKVYKNLKKALDSTKGCTTRVEKELAVHDWIISHTKYTYASMEKMQDYYQMEGVFIHGKAVCNGYMNAFKLCLKVLDIPCETVLGISKSQRAAHSWLRIKLDDGKWYHCDATFDDPLDAGKDTGVIHYNYFNCTDKQMTHMYYIKSRKCTATKYAVKNVKKDYLAANEQELCQAIKQAVKRKDTKVQLFVASDYHVILPADKILSSYVGSNISVSRMEAIPMRIMRKEVTPTKKDYHMQFYQITYENTSAVETPVYISSNKEMQDYLVAAIKNGQTTCTNLYFSLDSLKYYYYFQQEAVLYDLTGKHIKITLENSGKEVPDFLCPGGVKYYDGGDLVIDYSCQNDTVIIPATIDDFIKQLDLAVKNRQTSIILYGKNLNTDDLDTEVVQWGIDNRDVVKKSNEDFLFSYNRAGYQNPETGVTIRPSWYAFTFEFY